MITEDSSIIFYGDSSDEAAGVGVYQVKIPDARDVKIPEDLQDPMISIMAMCFARGHSDDKIDWLTYQNETELMVEALEKMGKRITDFCFSKMSVGVAPGWHGGEQGPFPLAALDPLAALGS